MKMRVSAAVTAVLFGVTAPVSSAMAFGRPANAPAASDVTVTQALGVHDHPEFTSCPLSSAAEGNANQQNFPVKQYGQNAGGGRC